MKAMVLHRPAKIETKPLKYENVPLPRLDDKEVLIKIGACGVCRSQLHLIEGDWGIPDRLPLIVGHEIAGTVTKIGKKVRKFKIGDSVGLQPTYSACGTCEYCRLGKENLCKNRQRLGRDVDGGYAEYVKGVESDTYKIPKNIPHDIAAPLFCPAATAYRAVQMAEPSRGKTIAVFGIGGVGYYAIQFAKLSKARVVAVSRDANKLKLAKSLGALPMKEDKANESRIKDQQVDSSIVFAPSNDAISMANRVTKKGGIVVLGVSGNIENFMFSNELTIKGCLVGSRADIYKVLRLAAEGKIKSEISSYPLKKANEVMLKLKQGKIVGRAVVIP